jgi:hypothetical protein
MSDAQTKKFAEHGRLDQKGLEALSMPQLVELFNAVAEKKVKVFKNKSIAVERVWASYPESDSVNNDSPETNNENEDEMAKKNGTKAKKAAAPKKANGEGGKRGRAPTVDMGLKIKILVDGNPKRQGSSSYKRFAKYENGMTVEEALKKGVKSADIHWDVKHNFIALR